MKTRYLIIFIIMIGCTGQKEKINSNDVSKAQNLIGMNFTEAEKDSMLDELQDYVRSYQEIRTVNIDNSVFPAIQFNPHPAAGLPGDKKISGLHFENLTMSRPENLEEAAFYSIRELAYLIRTKQVSSTELTKMYLSRLKKYNDTLHCVISFTEERALQQAARADKEIAAGKYRGYLHGIPYGAKDLLAVEGYKTTWGAMPFKDQTIENTASVIKKLDEAGAVLIAKLSLGALAWGDVWYGAKTRNPWNPEQGSSGSSAGSASATAAGLVAFSIGSETWGSIVSPSTRCGTTGHRPTYGTVSRTGAMALSWSMDKLGPICRSAEDCAIVFNAIKGSDGIDPTVQDIDFNYNFNIKFKDIRFGYLKAAFEQDSAFMQYNDKCLAVLREMGAVLKPIALPDYPVNSLAFILSAEAAAAFDDLTRSGKDDMLVRQIKNAWPNVFRAARFISAVEYIQANRIRKMMIDDFAKTMKDIDVYVAPSFAGNNLLFTNLSGHPAVVVPNGFREDGTPVSITFNGNLYKDDIVVSVAAAYQKKTDFEDKHPEYFSIN